VFLPRKSLEKSSNDRSGNSLVIVDQILQFGEAFGFQSFRCVGRIERNRFSDKTSQLDRKPAENRSQRKPGKTIDKDIMYFKI
jgi:hypothetical protein